MSHNFIQLYAGKRIEITFDVSVVYRALKFQSVDVLLFIQQ